MLGLIGAALAQAGLDPGEVAELATLDGKSREPGIMGAAARLGVPVLAYAADELAAVAVPHGSRAALAAVGTPSVAEAAALARGGELLVPKRKSSGTGRAAMATCAIVRRPHLRPSADGRDAPPTRSEEAMPIPTTEVPLDLRHHGDAEVRDDGGELIDLAVNVRTGTPRPGCASGSPTR